MKAVIIFNKETKQVIGRYNQSHQSGKEILQLNYPNNDNYESREIKLKYSLTVNDYGIDADGAVVVTITDNEINKRNIENVLNDNKIVFNVLLHEINELRIALSLPIRGKLNIQDFLNKNGF